MSTRNQITLIQIDNYGPWTVTPEPRREVDLQTLQSNLFADLSQLFGNRGGYVFFTRADNMVAVTNGIGLDDHSLVQESVGNRYPVTISMSVATAENPMDAITESSNLLQDSGSAQDESRKEILRGTTLEDTYDDDLQIAHFDVNDATDKYTDEMNAFDTFIHIEQGYAELMRYMRRAHDSVSFFVGGDNVISVCSGLSEDEFEDAIKHVEYDAEVELKVGVGVGETAQDAGMEAKHALERCREEKNRIEIG